MRFLQFCALCWVALLVTGISLSNKNKKTVVGQWKVNLRTVVPLRRKIEEGPKQAFAVATMKSALNQCDLDFKTDKTFVFLTSRRLEGTWQLENSSGIVELKTTKVNGDAVSQTNPAPKLSCTLNWMNTGLLVLESGDSGVPFMGIAQTLAFEKG